MLADVSKADVSASVQNWNGLRLEDEVIDTVSFFNRLGLRSEVEIGILLSIVSVCVICCYRACASGKDEYEIIKDDPHSVI